jgi:hypothetical protein
MQERHQILDPARPNGNATQRKSQSNDESPRPAAYFSVLYSVLLTKELMKST